MNKKEKQLKSKKRISDAQKKNKATKKKNKTNDKNKDLNKKKKLNQDNDKKKQLSKYKFKAKIISGKFKNKVCEIIDIKKNKYVVLKGVNLKSRFIPFFDSKKKKINKRLVKIPGKIDFSNVKFIKK